MIEEETSLSPDLGQRYRLRAVCDGCGLDNSPEPPRPAWHGLEGSFADREMAEHRLRSRIEEEAWTVIEGPEETLLCPGCKES